MAKIAGAGILLILILLFTIPLLFKDQIKVKVDKMINESVNAQVKIENYKLSFFRSFPNLAFDMTNVSVVGNGVFENDTLAGFNSFNLVFNLSSLFKKSGYEIKSVIINKAVVNAIYLEDGSANWDIVKDTTEVPVDEEASSSDMKVLLKKVEVNNSSVSYIDKSSDMEVYLNDLSFDLNGDMTLSETNLDISLDAGELTFIMEDLKYLNKVAAQSEIELLANLDSMKFTFLENFLLINDLKINFSGTVAMPGDDIKTDLRFGTEQSSFKSLLSLIPAVYMKDYQDLTAAGDFVFNGSAIGVYSDADSTLPDMDMNLSVTNGLISYPDLPEQIKNINVSSNVFVDGRDMDKTTVNIDKFHLELAGSPFDMTFFLKTPMSDPDFKGSMIGKIDLTALSKAIPLDSIRLSGILDMSVAMGGKLSMIEKEQYENFQASGKMGIKNMIVAMTGYPEVNISEADFMFTPSYAALSNGNMKVGGESDFSLSGRIENYIPWFFKNATVKGNMSVRSNLVDVSEILSKMAADTSEFVDTASLAVIRIPKNIDFDLNAVINNFTYENIKARDVKGQIVIRDGVLSLRETGMNMLGGAIMMNADYDTRDSLKPSMKADFNITNMGIKDAFESFKTVQSFAPAAKGIDGTINTVFSFESLLGSDMMPIMHSISGGGKLMSDQVTLLESVAFNKLKELLKLGEKYTNTFKNLNISFNMKEGRVYVSPFDVSTGNLKMNISGDQGLDKTMNYVIKTAIPRADLGGSVNALIDNLASQAAAFGISYKPADIIRVNVKVTGLFGKPVVQPFFGDTPGESAGGVKETAKETVRQTIDTAVDSGREKLLREAEAQGDKLIKEAETRGQQLRDEAARAAEKIRQEADVQAQKLIDSAASKGMIAKAAAQKGADSLRAEADKKANAVVKEADEKATNLVEEAKTKKQELIDKV